MTSRCTRKRRHVTFDVEETFCVGGPMALRRALLAAALAAAAAEVNVSCQIFEETMICDNAAQGVVRGEIRTCSG